MKKNNSNELKSVYELADNEEVKALFETSAKMITDIMEILHINQLTFTARYTSEKRIKIEWDAKR